MWTKLRDVIRASMRAFEDGCDHTFQQQHDVDDYETMHWSDVNYKFCPDCGRSLRKAT